MRDASLLLPATPGDVNTITDSVAKVLNSRTFEKTPALRTLLAYLWRNREACISEYAIATEALGRPLSFDARTDATVRVQISRLRQRLDKFYEEEGRESPERLIIPLGSHRVEVETVARAVVPGRELLTAPAGSAPDRQSRWPLRALSGLIVLLAIVAGAQAVLLHGTAVPKAFPSKHQTPWLWSRFFANGRQTRIVLPTPTFFSFKPSSTSDTGAIMFRDTEVNDFSQRPTSPIYATAEKLMGKPFLAENYTVTSDTFASIDLARYLDRLAFETKVNSSADAPLEALDHENVIAVGTWGTLTPLKPYLDTMSLELGPHESYVLFRHPVAGEPERIEHVAESPDRGIWPGIIAVLPGNGANTNLLILASRHTSALVSILTSTEGLAQLDSLWRAKGSPAYFEVAVNAEMSGRGLVRSWPVALHPYVKTP